MKLLKNVGYAWGWVPRNMPTTHKRRLRFAPPIQRWARESSGCFETHRNPYHTIPAVKKLWRGRKTQGSYRLVQTRTSVWKNCFPLRLHSHPLHKRCQEKWLKTLKWTKKFRRYPSCLVIHLGYLHFSLSWNYFSSVNWRKLIVMQMILVHRNINCVQWNATNYCLVDMLSVASFTLSKFTSSSPIDLSVHLLVYSSFKPVVTSYWLLHQSMSEISSLIHVRFAFARIFLNYPLAISKSSCWPQPTSVESLELSYN